MRIFIETFGCSSNQAESEIMAGLLEKAGSEVVNNIDISDVIIVNSCIVKGPSEQKLFSRLKQIQENYPDKKLIIAGCAPEGIYNELKEIAPEASFVSTHHIKEITKAVADIQKGEIIELIGETKEIKLCLPKIRNNPVRNIVQIASGCNSNCSYCITRFAKGELFSYPKELIIKEISMAVENGCKEIWLTSQDNSCYGFDSDTNLPELLNSLPKGKFLVRIGMMNPRNFLEKDFIKNLIEAYKSEKIYKFLHLPVQSGSDNILKKMNRGYKSKNFKRIVSEFRKEFPKLNLWTDVIVGFPSESKADFEKTLEMLKEVKPDYTNISQYGVRPRTKASKLKQISSEEKKKRSRIISELTREISLEKNKEWIDWKGKVLITDKKETWLGRNFAYKPVLINSKEKLLGKFINVKIIDATQTSLIGEII